MTSHRPVMSSARCLVVLGALCALQPLAMGYIRAGCTVQVNVDLPDPQPLLLKPGGSDDGLGFHAPTTDDQIILPVGGQIRLACPGSSNHLALFPSDVTEETATCVGGTTFTVRGGSYSFNKLACKSLPSHTARASGEKCYDGKPIAIDIGFDLDTQFIKVIDVCFDEATRDTLYSQFDLISGIAGYEVGFPRPNFVADSFYPGMSIDDKYTRKGQRQTFGTLLGSDALAGQYIHETDDYYLARGHLTAKADFVYGSQQRATFHYVNVAPQWQTFNGANWNTLEYNVRTFAAHKALNLKVYTGTHGITTLPNVANIDTPLYLYSGSDGQKVPVPKLFWKVLYNPKTKEGIVFLGVNNPYIPADDLGSDYRICTDLCSKVSWLTWSPKDVKKGIAYCCDVNDFRTTVKTLPAFEVAGLLT